MCDRNWNAPWSNGSAPSDSTAPARLKLYNSLVDKKVPFVPAAGPDSNYVTWYSCGPTVYDSAHMGHARNYLTLDIVRRVMEDYFNFSIMYVMNVTDVEDKIILRARRNYLLKQYKEKTLSTATVFEDAHKALAEAQEQQLCKAEAARAALSEAKLDASRDTSLARKVEDLASAVAEQELLLQKAETAVTTLNSAGPTATLEVLFAIASDALAEALDKKLRHTVTDPSIFRAHAAKYEEEFLDDMAVLGCRPPTVLTRVTEYMDEIVAYVGKILENNMGYELDGSIYFDTQAFQSSGHTYGKLNPWAVGSTALGGEGDGPVKGQKKHPSDFALWKAAKPGEPTWPSPWGPGRPGWHIECSAMASALVGSKLDIHTGGEDLRFPHHDNELAQAEAFYHCEGCQQWVNYFFHSGHLGIEGLKMSKSLKNFVTIREALESFTPRQLRLMFLLQPWERRMTYGESAKEEMKARETQLRNFFANIQAASRGKPGDRTQRWEADELTLQTELAAAQAKVHNCLLDNINTRGAMDALSDLIKATNVYLSRRQGTDSLQPQPWLLRSVSGYVSKILGVFGMIVTPADNPGFDATARAGAIVSSSNEQVALLDAFGTFRQQVRRLALEKAAPTELLRACDRARDETMIDLGVRLEDLPDGSSVWKPDDPALLRAEIAEKTKRAAEARLKKLKTAVELRQRELEKFEKLAALPPPHIALSEKYSKFDGGTGEPIADAEGNALEGKALDKAKKDYEKVKKVRAPLEKKITEQGEDFMVTMREEVERLTAELEQQL